MESTDSMFRQRVKGHVENNYDGPGVRALFSKLDGTDINSNTYEIPVQRDPEPPSKVAEGEEFPGRETELETIEVTAEKFGFQVGKDENDDEDILDRVDKFYNVIALNAVSEIYDNLDTEVEVSGSRINIIRDAIFSAGPEVPYGKIDTVVLSDVLAESIEESQPARDWGDIRDDLEEEYEIRIIVDQFNVLRGSDVIVANSSRLGYEFVRSNVEVKVYEEFKDHYPARWETVPEEDRTVRDEIAMVWKRLAFVVVDENAGKIVHFVQV